MKVDPNRLSAPARAVAEASVLMESVARAANPLRSIVGRSFATASAINLGARLLPRGLEMLRRYPVAATLTLSGILWVAWSEHSRRKGPASVP